jgi:hypothetical protein
MAAATFTMRPLPEVALGTNSPEREPCRLAMQTSCEQLATVEVAYQVAGHEATTYRVCPEHAAEWAREAADPDDDEWLGDNGLMPWAAPLAPCAGCGRTVPTDDPSPNDSQQARLCRQCSEAI